MDIGEEVGGLISESGAETTSESDFSRSSPPTKRKKLKHLNRKNKKMEVHTMPTIEELQNAMFAVKKLRARLRNLEEKNEKYEKEVGEKTTEIKNLKRKVRRAQAFSRSNDKTQEENEKCFITIQSNISEISKSLSDFKSEIGQDLKNSRKSWLKTNSEILDDIKSSLDEKFTKTEDFGRDLLNQLMQKRKTDQENENEIKNLNDTIENLKQENSELKSTVKVLTNLKNTATSNEVEDLKNKLEQANEKIADQQSEHLISMEKCQKEKEHLEAKLARSDKTIEAQYKDLSKALDLIGINSKKMENIHANLKQAEEKHAQEIKTIVDKNNELTTTINKLKTLGRNLKKKNEKYENVVGEKNSEIEKLMKTCDEHSNSLAKCQEENENLEVELARSNASSSKAFFDNKCEELSTSLKTNQELVQENQTLKRNCKSHSNSLAKSKEELKNLQESLIEANSKKAIQSKERQILENQMNILMDLMKIPNENRKFHQLRQEIENLMVKYIREKECAENLATNFPIDSRVTDK